MTRRPADYYPTPPECVEALRLWLEEIDYPSEGTWLEPSAGSGAIIAGLSRPGADWRTDPSDWIAWEPDPGRCETLRALGVGAVVQRTTEGHPPVSLIGVSVVANPPFSHLDEHVRQFVTSGAHFVAALARAQWYAEPGRAWLRALGVPSDELRMCWRPSFTGDGRADNAVYSWHIWRYHALRGHTRTRWVERPAVSDEDVARHRRLAQPGAPEQGVML